MPEEIYYYKCPLGVLQIGASDKYIHALTFVTQDAKEVSSTRNRKPKLEIIQNCREQLDAYFQGSLFSFDLNTLQNATEFQRKVWSELQKIEYGKTVSYLDLSRNMGNVKAIRAVGSANGKNGIPIIIPCHRVIGSNGNLVGYSGGLWRKHWLLNHEAKFSKKLQLFY